MKSVIEINHTNCNQAEKKKCWRGSSQDESHTHTRKPSSCFNIFSEGQCNTATCCWGIPLCCYYTPEHCCLFDLSSWLIRPQSLYWFYAEESAEESCKNLRMRLHPIGFCIQCRLSKKSRKNLERILEKSKKSRFLAELWRILWDDSVGGFGLRGVQLPHTSKIEFCITLGFFQSSWEL